MTREEKVRKAISVLIDCAEAAKGTEFADYYLMGADSLRQQETVTNRNGLNEPLTNAQKIRAMTNEELAKLLCCTGWRMIERKECLEWLQQPAEEDKHENLD